MKNTGTWYSRPRPICEGNRTQVPDRPTLSLGTMSRYHDDVTKWKHFPRYWPFVRGIHWSSVNSSHKGQWRGALMFSLICAWINGWVNDREACDLRRHPAHYYVTVMILHRSWIVYPIDGCLASCFIGTKFCVVYVKTIIHDLRRFM